MNAKSENLTVEQANASHLANLLDNRKRVAKEKVHNLVRSYPRDTPDDWVVFGYAGTKVNLGDLKDLFGIER